MKNLKNEGIKKEKIFFVGNSMIDSVKSFLSYSLKKEPWLKYKLEKECDNSLDKVKESVYNYTKPIINHKVGNTIDHGQGGF